MILQEWGWLLYIAFAVVVFPVAARFLYWEYTEVLPWGRNGRYAKMEQICKEVYDSESKYFPYYAFDDWIIERELKTK